MDNNKENPYLSLIMPSRNDNHGGNMFARMMASINGLLEQLEKYRIKSELIFVEWNPPEDKPLLKDVIKWPLKLRYCTIKAIQVPFSIHQRFSHSNKAPIYVGAAMNCGIRRARGTFILPSAIDSLYSDELMAFIAEKKLKGNELYRVDRCDVNRDVIQRNSLQEQLNYCKKNIIHIHCHPRWYTREGLPKLHTDACGDFQLMSRRNWHLLRGYKEGDIVTSYADSLLSYASYAAGIKEVVLKNPMRVYHIDHGGNFASRLEIKRPALDKYLSLLFNSIRPFIPTSISSKMVFLYHKFIGSRSKSTADGIPILDYIEYLNIARDVISGNRSYIYNGNDWGIAQDTLPEYTVSVADLGKKSEIDS